MQQNRKNDFASVGFLSLDLTEFTRDVRAKEAKWFSLAERLNRVCVALAYQIGAKDDKGITILAAYARGLQSYQGALLLAERGMLADGLSLQRSMVECVITIGCAAQDGFLDRLVEDHYAHRRQFSQASIDDPMVVHADAEMVMACKEAIAEAKALYPEKGRPKGIVWKDCADSAGLTTLYNLFYRGPSGNAAHVNANALNRHIVADDGGDVIALCFEPESDGIDQLLSNLVTVALHLVELVHAWSPLPEEIRDEVTALKDEWKQLGEPIRS